MASNRLLVADLYSGVVPASSEWYAQEIMRIWSNLRVQFWDPGKNADKGIAPWRIMQVLPNGKMTVLLYCKELDGRTLEEIHKMSTKGHEEKTFQEAKAKAEKERAAKKAEADEFAKDVVATGVKHLSKHPKFTFHDESGELRTAKGVKD